MPIYYAEATIVIAVPAGSLIEADCELENVVLEINKIQGCLVTRWDLLKRFSPMHIECCGQEVLISEPGRYELVRIPGGRFHMGSPKAESERSNDEGPLHEVQVPDFYLGRYPVTNEEYGRFLRENPEVKEPEYWADRRFNSLRQPVVGVSWEDAWRYAAWAGLRLPSEAE